MTYTIFLEPLRLCSEGGMSKIKRWPRVARLLELAGVRVFFYSIFTVYSSHLLTGLRCMEATVHDIQTA